MITIGDLIGLPVVRYWVNLLKVAERGRALAASPPAPSGSPGCF